MARKRVKKRTHLGANTAPSKKGAAKVGSDGMNKKTAPKSMVIRIGASDVGSSVSQLVKDIRGVMEPGTASRLKERKANKLRDYTTMSGPLGVSHLLLFSRSPNGNTNFRLAVTPRGPTLHFKVEKYSLCKDVARSQKRPKAMESTYLNPPLLVMNNFVTQGKDPNGVDAPAQTGTNPIPRHLETLTATVFQSLFPPISPQSTSLSTIRRVLLLNRETSYNASDPSTFTLNLRHYAITTKQTSLSKGVRRLTVAEKRSRKQKTDGEGKINGRLSSLPNLSRLGDVSDLLLDPSGAMAGFTSESEVDTDAEIEVTTRVAKQVLSQEKRQRLKEQREAAGQLPPPENDNADSSDDDNQPSSKLTPNQQEDDTESRIQKLAVRLTELGPRLHLRMIKVEEGLCEGRIMWHEFMHKTAAEKKELDAKWNAKNEEKARRTKEQKENVERKKREKEENRRLNGQGSKKVKTGEGSKDGGDGKGRGGNGEGDDESEDEPIDFWSDVDDDDDHLENGHDVGEESE